MSQENNQAVRQMPSASAIEQTLLGSLLLYPETFSECRDQDLMPEEFFIAQHQIIYREMKDLYDSGQTLTFAFLSQRLLEKNLETAAGGLEYLAKLMDSAVSSAYVKSYVTTIKQKAQQRELIKASEEITRNAFESTDDLDDLLDYAERTIMDVTRIRRGSEFRQAKNVISIVLDEIEKLKQGKGVTGIPTGFSDLDNMTNGFHAGELIILAARPAMGKSALALNLANGVAKRSPDGAVAIFSLEMPAESLMKRMLASESRVDSKKISSGKIFSQKDMNALFEAGNRLSERNIFIDDTSLIKVSQIFSKCRKLKSQYGKINLVVIDYLQLLTGSGKSDSRQQEVSEISRNLKILANEMECPVLALSQLSRKVEERKDHEPQLSDLRESGSIEQDADIVMFIYREDYYKTADETSENPVEVVDLSLKKHRNGETGSIPLIFEKAISLFSSQGNQNGDDIYAG